MKISDIRISVFELPGNTSRFDLEEEEAGGHRRWRRKHHSRTSEQIHLLHVRTDAGIEGICTVGDARYTTMRREDLEQLRILTVGHNPFDRERLGEKLYTATRTIFTRPGWYGAFDNCLWDIAGKAAGLPVGELIGRSRSSCPAYYNCNSASLKSAVESTRKALDLGFPAVKDHFHFGFRENIRAFAAVRDAVGPEVPLFHDAATCQYTYQEALRVGRSLEELDFAWFEEPLEDRDQIGLQNLCARLDIPILAPETLMHDVDLSSLWLRSGAIDLLRANARHSTTSLLKLAHLAQLHSTTVELNGPGGLFGLVHAHLVCALANTSYYEYFPGGSRDELGKEIGLLNPPLPQNGHISPPDGPGWGAEWDRDYFEKKRVAEL